MSRARENRRRKARATRKLAKWRRDQARWRAVDAFLDEAPLAFARWIGGAA